MATQMSHVRTSHLKLYNLNSHPSRQSSFCKSGVSRNFFHLNSDKTKVLVISHDCFRSSVISLEICSSLNQNQQPNTELLGFISFGLVSLLLLFCRYYYYYYITIPDKKNILSSAATTLMGKIFISLRYLQ